MFNHDNDGGRMMFLVKFKDQKGCEWLNLYREHERFFSDTFNPECEIIDTCDLIIKGKTYNERKESCADLAKKVQSMDSGGLSCSEYALLGNFFSRNARKYGLVREFRENGII